MAEALEPGASVSAIAHRLGIHPSQLFGWRRAVLAARKVSTEPARCEVVAASRCELPIGYPFGQTRES
ncbi:transposase [Ensifer aridi]|uniref:transposase n=1 Tax=Ensifer aridi TaxID=1708715 RepID=UPI00097C5F30